MSLDLAACRRPNPTRGAAAPVAPPPGYAPGTYSITGYVPGTYWTLISSDKVKHELIVFLIWNLRRKSKYIMIINTANDLILINLRLY